MKLSSPTNVRLARLRNLLGRFAFASLVAASFILMLVGKGDIVLVARTRMLLADMLAPTLEFLSRPAASIAQAVESVVELATLREENARLREENARLLRWQATARVLEEENNSLRDLLRYKPPAEARSVTGRVVADMAGVYAQSLLVTVGERDLVRRGHVVFSGEGLIGRISEVGTRSSRVLLLTDINSRIPVLVGVARQRAILAGDNSGRPRLLFLRMPQLVTPGDLVVTSGDSGVFPSGLAVGMVVTADENEIRVEPLLRQNRMDYVRVVDFGLEGVLEDVNETSAEKTR